MDTNAVDTNAPDTNAVDRNAPDTSALDTSAGTVSVVVPSYHSAKTLAACLDAVYAQSHPPLEVIVVDDASSDDSAAIARRYPCRLIVAPVNRGVSAARNTGAAASRGDVLFFVDSDIALAPDALRSALRVLAGDPECALVQGIYDREPLFADGPVEEYKTLYEHFWRRRAAGPVTVTLFALTAVRREVFDRVGGFDEGLRDGEDVEFGTRLPAGTRILMSAEMVGRHDDVDRLRPLLREQYRRATLFAVNLARGLRRGGRAGVATARTDALGPAAVLSCAATLASLPLPLLALLLPGTGAASPLLDSGAPLPLLGLPALSLALLGLPVLAAAAFLAANRDLLGFVRRVRGVRFAGRFAGLHFLLTAATVCGTGVGLLRLLAAPWRWRTAGSAAPARVAPGALR
ncbi:glycosyltransferase family 2 protein [Micromonospora sp. WMMD1102]|uniref:glycosyltransferase family 2 protein n=1 Tax=Micromonospora sp. WMMD1102 TaxID=3016105 RepID=UPI00241514C3|nr:glycosyltransferase family 2 protein [Micromonospora sp. WMMD1102]MDG4784836.1 glycosyltransferase family 2 protein [Micromonospora sp. WMMD1102]